VFLPIGNKLKRISHDEVHARTMLIEGVISIQAGDNPRVVEEKLRTFLDPAERALLSGEQEGPGNVEELRQAA
jgi:chemotaxis protein MotA